MDLGLPKNKSAPTPPTYDDIVATKKEDSLIYENGDPKNADFQQQEEEGSEEPQSNNIIYRLQNACSSGFTSYKNVIIYIILGILFVGYTVYFAFAIRYSVNMSMALIVITAIVVAGIIYAFIRDHFGDTFVKYIFGPLGRAIDRNWFWIRWFLYPIILIAIVVYLAGWVIQEVRQLQSLSGFVLYIILMYVTSKHPDKINFRPVLWGYTIQFIMAIIVLRWRHGYIAVKFLGDEVQKFMMYAFEGAATVFGDPFLFFHPYVFMGMPMLIYIGAVMSILYYYGVTQWLATKLAWLMQKTMHTTAIETLSVTSNIFLHGMDSMLMLRNYLDRLTASEFNCLLVGNHATVAGFIFGFLVMFGAPPQHLLSAAFMSAPATFAIAKLNYPETEESITKSIEDVELNKGEETNVFEAAANGSAVAGKTVVAVVVNFISFLSILAFVNATFSWLGGRVGFPELSFELICSYIMWPLALIMGIEVSQCREAAKLIGVKLFTSEILAYQEMGDSYAAGLLNDRSRAIVTYALCGFSSVSTLAIAVGVWSAICPQRLSAMASAMFRVLVQANVSCFMTACVAGLFYSEDAVMFAEEDESGEPDPLGGLIMGILDIIPSYRDLMDLIGF